MALSFFSLMLVYYLLSICLNANMFQNKEEMKKDTKAWIFVSLDTEK